MTEKNLFSPATAHIVTHFQILFLQSLWGSNHFLILTDAMSLLTWQNSTSSHHLSRRPGVCCRSSRRRGWDRSSSVAQSSPAPGVLSAASDCRDTYSPGLVSAGTACTGRDGMPADTGGLHSLASWKEQLNTRGCDRSKIKALDGQN